MVVLSVRLDVWIEVNEELLAVRAVPTTAHSAGHVLEAALTELRDQANGSGLDFRPTALLNSDYKLLTRIMATRLAALTLVLLHEAQNGFVSGRSIHDTIAFNSAAQRLVRLGLAPELPVMIMLDFQKASDSLDSAYLLRALR
ncbi:Reverse transcriptase precursor [Globisporangium polare]